MRPELTARQPASPAGERPRRMWLWLLLVLAMTVILSLVVLMISNAVDRRNPVVSAPSDHRFTTLLHDDFNELNDQHWWVYSGYPSASGVPYDAANVGIDGGVLELTATYGTDGWTNAGVGSRVDSLYGRWTIRARIDQGQGTTFVALLWPTANEWTNEIDFAEDNGDPERDYLSWTQHQDGEIVATGDTELDLTQWHEYTVEWDPEVIRIIVDSEQIGSIENHGVDEPMRMALQTEAWPEPTDWQHGVDESTPGQVTMYIDWVEIEAIAD